MNHKSSFVVFAITLMIVFGISQLLSPDRGDCSAVAHATYASGLLEEVRHR
ncbi:hypothetical protein ACIRON_04735 [Nocardioides sp. NPDC101246]|uniref:hypothetical protein n=1 Tax=Nocardioides sp. NPDC101246 TaxID=3364336 RepID=UPI0037F13C0F